jgi:hypothetical protein
MMSVMNSPASAFFRKKSALGENTSKSPAVQQMSPDIVHIKRDIS